MALLARDVMTPDPSTVGRQTPLYEAAREIIEKRYSGIPVTEEGTLIGLVEVEDLLPRPSQVPFTRVPVLEFQGEWVEEDDMAAYYRALQEMTIDQVMRTEGLPVIDHEAPIGNALKELVSNAYRRLLVMEDERLVGVVTRTDLLRVMTGGQ